MKIIGSIVSLFWSVADRIDINKEMASERRLRDTVAVAGTTYVCATTTLWPVRSINRVTAEYLTH